MLALPLSALAGAAARAVGPATLPVPRPFAPAAAWQVGVADPPRHGCEPAVDRDRSQRKGVLDNSFKSVREDTL